MLRLLLVMLLAAPAFAQRPDDPKPEPGESLPDAPKADPKSEHQPLTKEKTLILEKKPDGSRRVLIASEVCLREGQLEVFLCKLRTKEHEAIVRTDMDASLIHAALLAAGGVRGKPVQYSNPTTGEPDYKAATGGKVNVSVHYTLKGKSFTHPAQDWIQDVRTKKAMTHNWVFAGSRFVKNSDRPNDPDYYCANNGEIICVSNFPDSMLDLPVEIGKDDGNLNFQAFTEKIPPKTSKVWVILEPVAAKK